MKKMIIILLALSFSCSSEKKDDLIRKKSNLNTQNSNSQKAATKSRWSSCEIYNNSEKKYVMCTASKSDDAPEIYEDVLQKQCNLMGSSDGFETYLTHDSICERSKVDLISEGCKYLFKNDYLNNSFYSLTLNIPKDHPWPDDQMQQVIDGCNNYPDAEWMKL